MLPGCKKDILIATPMRVLQMIEARSVDLSGIVHLVMDEADRLFDMGFVEQVDRVLAACSNKKIVRCLFSATIQQGVENLARTALRNAIRVTVGARNAAQSLVTQRLVYVGSEDGKLLAMRQLVQQGLRIPMLIFVQSKERATQLFKELVYDGINVDSIHSDRTASQRTAIINNFRLGKIWVLICTDLMARGIDFKNVKSVLNYDFPLSTAQYIHRIGRTGRAGRAGDAVTFFTDDDRVLLHDVAHIVSKSGSDVPPWMLATRKAKREKLKKLQQTGVARKPIAVNKGKDKGNGNSKVKGPKKSMNKKLPTSQDK